MENSLVTIQIAYALPSQQWVQTLQLPINSTIANALEACKTIEPFSQLKWSHHAVGIFGKKVSLAQKVQAGDRIEIYRTLIRDPKAARLARAAC